MKTLFKKSIKYTFATIATLKAGDTLLNYTTNTSLFTSRSALAEKSEDEKLQDFIKLQNDDVVAALLKKEFNGDLSKADPVLRVKYDFKLKTREEHLKEISDPK
jgi:hypothetical protein